MTTTPTAQEARDSLAAHLHKLIGEYWGYAYREGQENRVADTPEGHAGKCLSEIQHTIKLLAASPRPEPAQVAEGGNSVLHAALWELSTDWYKKGRKLRGWLQQTAYAKCSTELQAALVTYRAQPPTPAPPEPESAAPAVSDEAVHLRHVGHGVLSLFRGDEEVREVGVTPGIATRDRDELIARYNAFPALTAQVASLVAENERLREDREALKDCVTTWREAHAMADARAEAAEQQLAAREAALREAREDAERLDWLETHGPGWREYIDAARAATKEPT